MNAQDKKDLKKIVKETLLEFWDDVLEPVLDKLHIKTDRVEGKIDTMEGKIDTIEKEVKDLSQAMAITYTCDVCKKKTKEAVYFSMLANMNRRNSFRQILGQETQSLFVAS